MVPCTGSAASYPLDQQGSPSITGYYQISNIVPCAVQLVLLNCGAGEDLRVPWTARKSNQSILKEIRPEYSLEGLMLKLQYFGHLMQRTDSLEKTLMLGKIKGRRRRG